MRDVEAAYKDKPNVDRNVQAGYYATFAREVLDGSRIREDIRAALTEKISDDVARKRAQAPEKVLRTAKIVVNENHIVDAGYRPYNATNGERMFDLTVELTDEGRRRLWQFSKPRVGSQLLLTAGGIPIAAPRIGHELAQGELTITQMRDEGLVRDAVDLLKRGRARAAAR